VNHYSDVLNDGYGLKLPSMATKVQHGNPFFDSPYTSESSKQNKNNEKLKNSNVEKDVVFIWKDAENNSERKRTSFVRKKFNDGPPVTADGRHMDSKYNIISGL